MDVWGSGFGGLGNVCVRKGSIHGPVHLPTSTHLNLNAPRQSEYGVQLQVQIPVQRMRGMTEVRSRCIYRWMGCIMYTYKRIRAYVYTRTYMYIHL